MHYSRIAFMDMFELEVITLPMVLVALFEMEEVEVFAWDMGNPEFHCRLSYFLYTRTECLR